MARKCKCKWLVATKNFILRKKKQPENVLPLLERLKKDKAVYNFIVKTSGLSRDPVRKQVAQFALQKRKEIDTEICKLMGLDANTSTVTLVALQREPDVSTSSAGNYGDRGPDNITILGHGEILRDAPVQMLMASRMSHSHSQSVQLPITVAGGTNSISVKDVTTSTKGSCRSRIS